MTRYVVKDEHTLGYLTSPGFMDVLHGDPFKGGHNWKNGPTTADPNIDKIRPATLEDFERFRVCPRWHLEDME